MKLDTRQLPFEEEGRATEMNEPAQPFEVKYLKDLVHAPAQDNPPVEAHTCEHNPPSHLADCTYSTRGSDDWGPIASVDETNLPAFPVDAFPVWLAIFINAVAQSTETPTDLAAILCLAVCAATVAKTHVAAYSDAWIEPLNLFALASMPPAGRKSVVFKLVTRPLRDHQEAVNRERQQEIAAASVGKDLLEKKLSKATQGVLTASADKVAEAEEEVTRLAQELERFQVPSPLRLIADDITPEQLVPLLANNGGRLAIMSPEGGIFETIAGRYSSGMPNLDAILKGHAGDDISVDRVGRAPWHVVQPALTMVLAVQPDVLLGLAEKPGFQGRGLLARYLYCLPKDNIGYRELKDIPLAQDVKAAYHAGILNLAR